MRDDERDFLYFAARDARGRGDRFLAGCLRDDARTIGAERRYRRAEHWNDRIEDLQRSGERLTLELCANPLFDQYRPVRRRVRCRGRREPAYEWTTYTDGYHQVGCTYFLRDGFLSIVAADPMNAQLFEGIVHDSNELDAALKHADRRHAALAEPDRTRRRKRRPAPKARKMKAEKKRKK